MTDYKALEAIFERLEAGKRLRQQELQALLAAVRSQEITIATGDRAVAIGGSADGAVIVTGDRNIVIHGAEAEAIRELMGKRPRAERLLLQAIQDEVTLRLKQSLHNAILIELGMETCPEQVKCPWASDIKIGNKPVEPIPVDWNILQVFDEVRGKLLILGSPGAGKTTMMLELAKRLCDRAEQDVDYPIPVVLDLSSWNNSQQPIQNWMVKELNLRYGGAQGINKKLLLSRRFLPLFDGLDEVRLEYQSTCIKAINDFLISENRPSCIVICSRYEEYKINQDKITCNGAIMLKELSREQIRDYLFRVKYSSFWDGLCSDINLLELLHKPLLLNIAVLSYQELKLSKWQQAETASVRIQLLLDAYIQCMSKRVKKSQRYQKPPDVKQTQWLLTFLARQLQREAETDFLIERISPNWLTNYQRWIYMAAVWLIVIVVIQLFLGNPIFLGLVYSPPGDLQALNRELIEGTGLLEDEGRSSNPFFGLPSWLLLSPVFASILWRHVSLKKVPLVETLRFSLSGFGWRRIVNGLRDGFLGGIQLGVAFGILAGLYYGGIYGGLPSSLVLAISFSLPSGLIGGCFGGLLGALLGMLIGEELNFKNKPNQGIFKSLRNSVTAALVCGLMPGIALMLILSITLTLIHSLDFGLIGAVFGLFLGFTPGLICGMIVWLNRGGLACIQHFVLRIILYFNNSIPWNYARFLDYCTDCLLLQRVGGRYRFIHRLLQEHFAAMPLERRSDL